MEYLCNFSLYDNIEIINFIILWLVFILKLYIYNDCVFIMEENGNFVFIRSFINFYEMWLSNILGVNYFIL